MIQNTKAEKIRFGNKKKLKYPLKKCTLKNNMWKMWEIMLSTYEKLL